MFKVGCNGNGSFKKKTVANLYAKRFVFFILNNSPGVAWHISLKDTNLKGFESNYFSVSSP